MKTDPTMKEDKSNLGILRFDLGYTKFLVVLERF